jgi:cytochrome c-type biogenesis protein CcsB
LVVSAYAALLVSFVLSILYLVRHYIERAMSVGPKAALASLDPPEGDNPTAAWLRTLPSLAQLDVLTYRAVAIGLPLLALGIFTGAMWAHESWGAYWQWDPKETAALFSAIVYLSYMHLHTRNNWKGLGSSWVSVLGFASIVFCYLGVNIWISGLHSYKM